MLRREVIWHGEGRTLVYVVEYDPDDEEIWEVIETKSLPR